jgi:HTH-type transcriptional regulator/antitoxin HigA
MKANLIVIENDADHAEAKASVEALLVSKDPKDAARLGAQARLIEVYERERWPRRVPRPADILMYLMEEHSLSRADLEPLLGTASRVSEVLNGKRDLSMTMIKRLRERFHVSADVLIPHIPRAKARKHTHA